MSFQEFAVDAFLCTILNICSIDLILCSLTVEPIQLQQFFADFFSAEMTQISESAFAAPIQMTLIYVTADVNGMQQMTNLANIAKPKNMIQQLGSAQRRGFSIFEAVRKKKF